VLLRRRTRRGRGCAGRGRFCGCRRGCGRRGFGSGCRNGRGGRGNRRRRSRDRLLLSDSRRIHRRCVAYAQRLIGNRVGRFGAFVGNQQNHHDDDRYRQRNPERDCPPAGTTTLFARRLGSAARRRRRIATCLRGMAATRRGSAATCRWSPHALGWTAGTGGLSTGSRVRRRQWRLAPRTLITVVHSQLPSGDGLASPDRRLARCARGPAMLRYPASRYSNLARTAEQSGGWV
jgi:hypothetical protein